MSGLDEAVELVVGDVDAAAVQEVDDELQSGRIDFGDDDGRVFRIAELLEKVSEKFGRRCENQIVCSGGEAAAGQGHVRQADGRLQPLHHPT